MSDMKVVARPLVNELNCMVNLARHYLLSLDYAKADTVIPTETLGLILKAFIGNYEKIQTDKIGIKEAPNPFAHTSAGYQNR